MDSSRFIDFPNRVNKVFNPYRAAAERSSTDEAQQRLIDAKPPELPLMRRLSMQRYHIFAYKKLYGLSISGTIKKEFPSYERSNPEWIKEAGEDIARFLSTKNRKIFSSTKG